MSEKQTITEMFGKDLAILLADKITEKYPPFNAKSFLEKATERIVGANYTQRLAIFAELLKEHLPQKYEESTSVLVSILGEENPHQIGMVTHFYWVLPIGKFVQEYGLKHFDISIKAIEELTKRSTGEFAVRPFIRQYPEKMLGVMMQWARSENFHLRRLATEGLRPKLPWATKLDIFIENPLPVFQILELLKEDDILYVKKSVANHLTDWIKVNPNAVMPLVERWETSENKHTQWIIKRATRILTKIGNKIIGNKI